jgi:hypothetical protein
LNCLQAQKSTALQAAFIPLPVPLTTAKLQVSSSNICVEIQHTHWTVKADWLTDNAAAYATFLRGLLRGLASTNLATIA